MSVSPMIRQAGALTAVIVAAGFSYLYLYDAPKRELSKRTTDQIAGNQALQAQVRDQQRVEAGLKELAATTLGSRDSDVDSKFRSALTAIASQNGLSAILVNSRSPVEIVNPGGNSKLTSPAGLRSTLKKQKDFSVISGDLEGKGTLEQVLRAMATVQAQPWVHRVDSFSIKPEGKERAVFSLKLGVSTILMPDLAPKAATEARIKVVEPSAETAAIVQKNVFKEPVAVAAAPAPVQGPGPASSAPLPYGDWRLAGVIESRLGVEAFMVNVKSGQKLSLPPGAVVADARFVSGRGEAAVFEIGGQQYEVLNGQTLEQRRPR